MRRKLQTNGSTRLHIHFLSSARRRDRSGPARNRFHFRSIDLSLIPTCNSRRSRVALRLYALWLTNVSYSFTLLVSFVQDGAGLGENGTRKSNTKRNLVVVGHSSHTFRASLASQSRHDLEIAFDSHGDDATAAAGTDDDDLMPPSDPLAL